MTALGVVRTGYFTSLGRWRLARKPVIAGNWKMYKTQAEARAYFAAFKPLVAR